MGGLIPGWGYSLPSRVRFAGPPVPPLTSVTSAPPPPMAADHSHRLDAQPRGTFVGSDVPEMLARGPTERRTSCRGGSHRIRLPGRDLPAATPKACRLRRGVFRSAPGLAITAASIHTNRRSIRCPARPATAAHPHIPVTIRRGKRPGGRP